MHQKSKQPSMPKTQDAQCKYWIAPIGKIGTSASDQIARELIGKHRIFATSEAIYSRNTPVRETGSVFTPVALESWVTAKLVPSQRERSTLEFRTYTNIHVPR